MMSNEASRFLSAQPYITYVQLGLTLAHIWFDHAAIDLTDSDVADLVQQIEWTTNGRILVRTEQIFNGVIELLIAPDYATDEPETFQQVLDYITLILRAACPSCTDYQEDRQHLQLPLRAEPTNDAWTCP